MGVSGTSWDRVLSLVKEVDGTRYITGHGAANYLNHQAFDAAGIGVEYMEYSLTTWSRGSLTPTPFVSVLDAVGWTGQLAGSLLKPSTVRWQEFQRAREQ